MNRRENSSVCTAANKLAHPSLHRAAQLEPSECQRLVRMTMLSWHSRGYANQKEYFLGKADFLVKSLACDFICVAADDMRAYLPR